MPKTKAITEVQLTDKNFREEVLESSTPVLVDFCADWLQQCSNISAIIDHLKKAIEGGVKIGRVALNDAASTAERYTIRAFPTFLLFKDGQVVDSLSGVYPEDEMVTRLKLMLQT
ncbi:MAG: thiol reductase thioredoxin [Ectothiorhodospiraceae bacterium]|nr:thiol reductase thioredoxin [Ectothiorhodospiraceae bacterium]